MITDDDIVIGLVHFIVDDVRNPVCPKYGSVSLITYPYLSRERIRELRGTTMKSSLLLKRPCETTSTGLSFAVV